MKNDILKLLRESDETMQKHKIVSLISRNADYDMENVIDIFMEVLTDINFHSERIVLEELFDKYKENNFSFDGIL